MSSTPLYFDKDLFRYLIRALNDTLKIYPHKCLPAVEELLIDNIECMQSVSVLLNKWHEKDKKLKSSAEFDNLNSVLLFISAYNSLIEKIFIDGNLCNPLMRDCAIDIFISIDEVLSEFIYCTDNELSRSAQSVGFEKYQKLIVSVTYDGYMKKYAKEFTSIVQNFGTSKN